MKLKTLQTVAVICLVTLTAGILVAKAEGPEGSTRSLKASLENKFEKKDVRNPLVEKVQQLRDMKASTTAQIKDIRKEGRQEIKDMRDDLRASTTMMIREFKGERKEMVKKMQLRTFEIRKNALVRELTGAIKNLTSIRARISERITKAEGSGRDMADAKAKLVIADGKLLTAKAAVEALASYSYASSTISVTASSTASTTAEISLDKPRKIGDDAIKAVKSARDAFKDVVRAIAHAMGLGGEDNEGTATTTASTTVTTTTSTSTATTTVDVTATTTASTTTN